MSDVVTTGVVRVGMTSRSGIMKASGFGLPASGQRRPEGALLKPEARSPKPSVVHYQFLRLHDLQTLWDRNRRQGADLLPLRPAYRRAAYQAADRRIDLRQAAPLEAAVAAGPAGARRARLVLVRARRLLT